MNVAREIATRFGDVIRRGGIAVFPTDTVYGIATDPDDKAAIDRVYSLKGRPPVKPSAVMYFGVERLLGDLGELDSRTKQLIEQLLPGPYTLIVDNPMRRFPEACIGAPEKLGLRVPKLTGGPLEALTAMPYPVLQTSANKSGQPDATALEDVDPEIRRAVDLEIDGGPLLGYASTVADVSELSKTGQWRLLRAPLIRASGALTELLGPPRP